MHSRSFSNLQISFEHFGEVEGQCPICSSEAIAGNVLKPVLQRNVYESNLRGSAQTRGALGWMRRPIDRPESRRMPFPACNCDARRIKERVLQSMVGDVHQS